MRNREAVQPIDNILLEKKKKTVWNHVLYRYLHNLWTGKGFSTLIFLFQWRKPSLMEVKRFFPSQRAVIIGF